VEKRENPPFSLYSAKLSMKRGEPLHSTRSRRAGGGEIPLSLYSAKLSGKQGNLLSFYSAKPIRREENFFISILNQAEWEGGKSPLPLLDQAEKEGRKFLPLSTRSS